MEYVNKNDKSRKLTNLGMIVLDDAYIDYLVNSNSNVLYEKPYINNNGKPIRRKRPHLAILVDDSGQKWAIPLSSPSNKEEQNEKRRAKPEINYEILAENEDESLGFVRFNNLIPIPDESAFWRVDEYGLYNFSYYQEIVDKQIEYINSNFDNEIKPRYFNTKTYYEIKDNKSKLKEFNVTREFIESLNIIDLDSLEKKSNYWGGLNYQLQNTLADYREKLDAGDFLEEDLENFKLHFNKGYIPTKPTKHDIAFKNQKNETIHMSNDENETISKFFKYSKFYNNAKWQYHNMVSYYVLKTKHNIQTSPEYNENINYRKLLHNLGKKLEKQKQPKINQENPKAEKQAKNNKETQLDSISIDKKQVSGETDKAIIVDFPKNSKYRGFSILINKNDFKEDEKDSSKLIIRIPNNPSFKCKYDIKTITKELSIKTKERNKEK